MIEMTGDGKTKIVSKYYCRQNEKLNFEQKIIRNVEKT